MARQSVVDGARMSFAEFRRLPEQPGLQLIDGMVVKEPSPSYGHQTGLGYLYAQILFHVDARELGRVVVAPFDVILDEQVLQPDVLFVSRERLGLIHEDGLYGAPDLVVELLSPSTRRYDVDRKRELYFAHGCREMWLVDVDARTVERLWRQGPEDAVSVGCLTGRDVLQTELLPGFSPAVAKVFDR